MPEQQNTNGCTEESCAGCAHADSCSSKKEDFREPENKYSSIKKVIGVVSGKGGVGKSLVTASLARMMREKGYTVGILDADITGPSIPKMYGIHEKARGTEEGILPCIAKDETRIMSVNLLLEDESAPVIWRGPIIAGVVKQFWTDVMWGDIDYLFVDMPPGTGDVPLTVFQSLPVDGVVIVTSPQDLVQMIVKKAANMAEQMNIPVLGIIENYSYVKCPDCGKEIKVFGESHVEEAAREMNVPVLGRMPIDIYRAKAKMFQIVDGKLMPSLASIEGMGDKAAEAVEEAAKDGAYLSLDDFRQRTKVSKTVIDLMAELGLFGDLPQSNQLSLFDFT